MSRKKTLRIPVERLQWQSNDPLAPEHELVARLISETLATGWQYYNEIDLSSTDAGKKILEASPDATARLVLALVAHAGHFDELEDQVRALAANEMERANWHHSPEWESIWPPRQVAAQTLRRLMRRKLPLGSQHLIRLADWIASADWVNDSFYPLNATVKAIESCAPIDPNDAPLRAALSRLLTTLRKDASKEAPKLVQRIEKALGAADAPYAAPATAASSQNQPAGLDASQPAPVGSPEVLVELKQFLGFLPGDRPASPTELVGLDRFPVRVDSPLRKEHELINMFLPEVVGTTHYYSPVLGETRTGKAMLSADGPGRARILLAAAERLTHWLLGSTSQDAANAPFWQSFYAISAVFGDLLQSDPELQRESLFDLLLFMTAISSDGESSASNAAEKFVRRVEVFAVASPLSLGERHVLYRLHSRAIRTPPLGHTPRAIAALTTLLGDAAFFLLVPGEAWSDTVNSDIGKLEPRLRQMWVDLFQHAAAATGSRPSAKWLKAGKDKIQALGNVTLRNALLRWFPFFETPRTVPVLGRPSQDDPSRTVHDDNATCLRGLLWLSPEVVSPDLIRTIGSLTVSSYRKVPGVGPRAVKVGNAGVYALSQINDPLAVGQLALLKVKVKFGSAQKEIEKAFTAAAERSGLPREELEEMSVPTYGLTDVGVCEEKMGSFTARLTVTGTDSTELVWIKPDGKTQRGTPAEVKTSHADDLKELQAAAKDIQKMLPAQRERIDGLFSQQRVWPFPVWRERYLDHPLIGTLARRILWEFTEDSQITTSIWFNGQLVDIDLKPIAPASSATVRLWHPIGRTPEEIAGWRSWLEAQQIQQPFKQAHREIYLLTEAEQRTRTYSNRYAAHVLKQHQFNALCALRGWKNKLRLLVDDEYPPASLNLPQWGLRAEFWIEGIGQDYGNDTNESGVFLRLSTDQVRFYRIDAAQHYAHAGGGGYRPDYRGGDAEPLPLDQIPPLVFSEVMRDVDLFVGVASVGNDPTWADGGPGGRYRDYWHDVSFGDLNATAKTRKNVLQRLVPKLKIASLCRFADKFLIVKGTLRTYKIHLGSGNILMEPNDQYLCIVPRQGETQDSPVLLPFEGDRTLSVILSKAFLLANDSKITDSSIVSQISRK